MLPFVILYSVKMSVWQVDSWINVVKGFFPLLGDIQEKGGRINGNDEDCDAECSS